MLFIAFRAGIIKHCKILQSLKMSDFFLERFGKEHSKTKIRLLECLVFM